MRPTPKIIKSSKFEDGTFSISAPVHPLPVVVSEAGDALDPARELAEAQSRAIMVRAQEEAQILLAEAREMQEHLRAQLRDEMEQERQVLAEATREQAYALGLEQGRAAGHQEVIEEHAMAIGRLHAAIEDATGERNRWFEAQHKDLIKLAVLIAQKALILELAHSREAVVRMAEEAIKHITDKTHVRLRAHPGDVARLNAARGQLLLATDNLTTFEIVADPTVGLGGCMIDTRTGMVDARLSTQLAEIAAKLLDIEPGPDGATDMDPLVLAAVRALGQGGHVLAAAAPPPTQAWQRPVAPAVPAPIQAGQAAGLAAALQAEAASPAVPATAPHAGAANPAAPAEALQAKAASLAVPTEATREVPAAPEPELGPMPNASALPPVMEAQIAAEPLVQQPAWEAWEAPEPSLVAEEPTSAASLPAPTPAPASLSQLDPSRRAADALAARLGKLKRGRGVTTLSEEFDMSKLEGALKDEELEAIVRNTAKQLSVPETSIAADQVLVHNPFALEDAAEILAEKLGKKPRKGRDLDGVLAAALDDQKIDEILGTILPRVASSEPAAPTAEPQAPDIDRASEALAKLLGQPKKKGNRAWYDQ